MVATLTLPLVVPAASPGSRPPGPQQGQRPGQEFGRKPGEKLAENQTGAPPLVPFEGRLPAPMVTFLGQLPDYELRDVSLIQGRFREVRELAASGRLLHRYLKEGPFVASRGPILFTEFFRVKRALQAEIWRLQERIPRAAEDAALILPSIFNTL